VSGAFRESLLLATLIDILLKTHDSGTQQFQSRVANHNIEFARYLKQIQLKQSRRMADKCKQNLRSFLR